MFPKKGNKFPVNADPKNPAPRYAAVIACALRAELGDSHQAVKTVMRWTAANERTVKNWLAATRGPSGEHLLALMRHSNASLEAVLRVAGREQILVGKMLLDARDTLVETLHKIDTYLNHGKREVF